MRRKVGLRHIMAVAVGTKALVVVWHNGDKDM
jgi:hypothetical protein